MKKLWSRQIICALILLSIVVSVASAEEQLPPVKSPTHPQTTQPCLPR